MKFQEAGNIHYNPIFLVTLCSLNLWNAVVCVLLLLVFMSFMFWHFLCGRSSCQSCPAFIPVW